jgi:hypothetical protein
MKYDKRRMKLLVGAGADCGCELVHGASRSLGVEPTRECPNGMVGLLALHVDVGLTCFTYSRFHFFYRTLATTTALARKLV